AQERVALRRVGHDEQVRQHGAQRVDDALDDALAAELQQRLGLAAHADAAPAGLDDARDSHRETVTAPCRITRGGPTVTSTTVEGAPPGVGPPSSTRSRAPPKWARHAPGSRPPRARPLPRSPRGRGAASTRDVP